MLNVVVKRKKKYLILTIDLTKDFGKSTAGRNNLVATTQGSARIPGLDGVRYNLNVWRFPGYDLARAVGQDEPREVRTRKRRKGTSRVKLNRQSNRRPLYDGGNSKATSKSSVGSRKEKAKGWRRHEKT